MECTDCKEQCMSAHDHHTCILISMKAVVGNVSVELYAIKILQQFSIFCFKYKNILHFV